MFLIDSSVWVEYLRPFGSPKAKERVRAILQREEAISCGVVIVEILRGAKTEKEYQALKDSLLALPQIPIDDEVIESSTHIIRVI